jgi:TRAP-type uncharacterized transport system substrate-binding protein
VVRSFQRGRMTAATSDPTRVLRLGTQNPAHPWWYISERIAEALIGFGNPILPGRRVALYTPPALQGARHNPIAVATGELDAAITTPSVTAQMATAGNGIYSEPYAGLRAIAAYPHIDFLVFMVDASTGITSLEELAERRYPLRLITGRRSADGVDDVLTFTIEQILRQYGISYASIEEWGGEVIYGGPTHIGGFRMLDGEANALFQEARSSPVWFKIADSRDVNVLAVKESAREHMQQTFGFAKAEVPAGHYRGVTVPVPTVDFSGWLLFCREDLPDEWAYALAQACDDTRPLVDDGDPEIRRSLDLPLDPGYMFNETVLPLHAGAVAYAQERGYLKGS